MGSLKDRTVALGVGGGIAAYKAADLARQLMKAGAVVRVAMTRAATRFVSPLTFQALTRGPVLTEILDPGQDVAYGHLDLARRAELWVVAPATADLLARVRAGMADDAVTTSLLASRCPVLLAPAMNVAMWENSLTQQNLGALLALGRYSSVGPNAGELADGDVGAGRLAEPAEIVAAAERLLGPRDLAGLKILITAGPTREAIDPVRFLSNPSSGRMGYALAQVAAERGAEVVLVSGPVELQAPRDATTIRVSSAEQMAEAVRGQLAGVDVFIGAAAVSDYRPTQASPKKIKKGEGGETLKLVRTSDILLEVSSTAKQGRPVLVGFAAETENLIENAREKLRKKKLDLVVANDVSPAAAARGTGFGTQANAVTLIAPHGEPEAFPAMDKLAVASLILDRVRDLAAARKPRG